MVKKEESTPDTINTGRSDKKLLNNADPKKGNSFEL